QQPERGQASTSQSATRGPDAQTSVGGGGQQSQPQEGQFLTRHVITGWQHGRDADGAVGRGLLKCAYHIIGDGSSYQDMGEDYYERRSPEQPARRLARRIEKLGFQVDLKSPEAPVPNAAPVTA